MGNRTFGHRLVLEVDGAGRTSVDRPQSGCLLTGAGLRLHDDRGLPTGAVVHGRLHPSAGVAVDAGVVDPESAGLVLLALGALGYGARLLLRTDCEAPPRSYGRSLPCAQHIRCHSTGEGRSDESHEAHIGTGWTTVLGEARARGNARTDFRELIQSDSV